MDTDETDLASLSGDDYVRGMQNSYVRAAAKSARNLTSQLDHMLNPYPHMRRELLALRSEKPSPKHVLLPVVGVPARSVSGKGDLFAYDLSTGLVVLVTPGAGTDRPYPTRELELVDVAHLFTLYQRDPAAFSLIDYCLRLRG